LLEAGHRVDIVARDLPLETTSSVAAAIWYPHLASPRRRVAAWSAATYDELARLSTDADTGVRLVEGSELHRTPTPDPWWSDAVPALTRVGSPRAPYVDGWTFTTPVVEMPVYLRWLTPGVTPVQGQVVYVDQVGVDRWWLDGDGPTYVVPRSHDIVVGGTGEEGDWNRSPDPGTADAILARAVVLVPELARARVLRHKVGLRPVRPEVRLEGTVGSTGSRVVHCYGHGGAGVTLSWGCADEVVALVGG